MFSRLRGGALDPVLATSQSDAPSKPSSVELQDQSANIRPLFKVDVVYAYVGPRTDHFTCIDPMQDKNSDGILNAKSLYPVVVYFNFTHISNAEVELSDAKMEVYIVQLTADTGVTETYTYAEATNYDPAFSDLDTLSSRIWEFDEASTTYGIGGGFVSNWTTGKSILGCRVGSYGSYTSMPSGLGLWSAGEPNTITLSVRRIGVISVDGESITTTADVNTAYLAQIQLERFGGGFLYNIIVSQSLSQIELFDPPMPYS